jgi:phosphoribosylglycinamide formyltransferase-1
LSGKDADFSVVVLISGGGSNLQVFIDAVASNALDIRISAVISNRPDAAGLARATRAGIDTLVLQNTDYPDRTEFDAALAAAIEDYHPDLIILAGFMRILTASFVNRFADRILNIHPSLLPKYPGLHTHHRALEDGESQHGCTVHLVTEELDGGPCIIQGQVPILNDDNTERLAKRVLKVEHTIYPQAVNLIASGRLTIKDSKLWLDGQPMQEPILANHTSEAG